MAKFKVGDRVAVYDCGSRCVGKIIRIDKDSLYVDVPNGLLHYHPKQCRLLKPKKKAPRGKPGGRIVYLSETDISSPALKNGARLDKAFMRNHRGGTTTVKFIEAEDQDE